MKKILTCVGTRPNLIKITQLDKYFSRHDGFQHLLLHTGQHFDYNMNEVFFEELKIRRPDEFLNINQGSQITVIARIMEAFEKYISEIKPDLVMVPGDVNSSFACAFVAQRHGIPLAHIESGLRSFDMTMPEEANRILIDDLSDIYFVTEESGTQNLLNEGKSVEKIHFIGNTMIDSLVAFMPVIEQSQICRKLNVDDYYLLTFHRPQNVDNKENLTELVRLITNLTKDKKVVFPTHPRTRQRLTDFGLLNHLKNERVVMTDPIGYIDFMHLVRHASVVLTDSGGVQEETTYLQVPCITVRPSTERPITVTVGTNTLTNLNHTEIEILLTQIKTGQYKKGSIPILWDGKSSERLVEAVVDFL